MHSAICKGMLKVGFWEAQKGLKRRRKKIAQRHWEAQFREDFRLHLTKPEVCGQNNSVVVSEILHMHRHYNSASLHASLWVLPSIRTNSSMPLVPHESPVSTTCQ